MYYINGKGHVSSCWQCITHNTPLAALVIFVFTYQEKFLVHQILITFWYKKAQEVLLSDHGIYEHPNNHRSMN